MEQCHNKTSLIINKLFLVEYRGTVIYVWTAVGSVQHPIKGIVCVCVCVLNFSSFIITTSCFSLLFPCYLTHPQNCNLIYTISPKDKSIRHPIINNHMTLIELFVIATATLPSIPNAPLCNSTPPSVWRK